MTRLTFPLLLALALAACATPPPREAPPYRAEAPVAPAPIPAPQIEFVRPPLQCVPFARNASGVQIYGDAYTWWAQAEGRYRRTPAPTPGAVMVFANYAGPARGHLAVVRAQISEREILIDHANWHNRGEITRYVPVRDESPANDWSLVRVWNTLGQHWGGRLTEVQGFILPD